MSEKETSLKGARIFTEPTMDHPSLDLPRLWLISDFNTPRPYFEEGFSLLCFLLFPIFLFSDFLPSFLPSLLLSFIGCIHHLSFFQLFFFFSPFASVLYPFFIRLLRHRFYDSILIF